MIVWDRATTKMVYGISDALEYGRWMGTFANGASMWRNMVNQKLAGQSMLRTARILVVGCGLGLLVEGLKDEGFTRVWGLNLDDYFGSLWDQATCPPGWTCEVRADVRPLLAKNDIRTITNTQMRALTGTNNIRFDVIVTEDMITSYLTSEMAAVYSACDAWLVAGGQVRHLVTVEWDSSRYGLPGAPTWTLNQWTASLGGRTNHLFQDIAGVSASVA